MLGRLLWWLWRFRGSKECVCAETSTRNCPVHGNPSDDECRCNEQARELGGEALREVESEWGRVDDERRRA